MQKSYVYILTNKLHTVLYAGVTVDLYRRLAEYVEGKSIFTAKYKVHKLVYVEEFQHIQDAIAREKQIKSWNRKRKMELIDSHNPLWRNLMDDGI